MVTINLRDYYPWYTQDEFVDVEDEVAAALLADKRYKRTHARQRRRNKVYALDAGDGMEARSIVSYDDSPERVLAMMERRCQICQALNSLPEIQAQRMEAYCVFGISQRDIANAEGVTKGAVSISITRGLAAMKKYYEKFNSGVKLLSIFCPDK